MKSRRGRKKTRIATTEKYAWGGGGLGCFGLVIVTSKFIPSRLEVQG